MVLLSFGKGKREAFPFMHKVQKVDLELGSMARPDTLPFDTISSRVQKLRWPSFLWSSLMFMEGAVMLAWSFGGFTRADESRQYKPQIRGTEPRNRHCGHAPWSIHAPSLIWMEQPARSRQDMDMRVKAILSEK